MIARRKVDRIDIFIPDQQNYFKIWDVLFYVGVVNKQLSWVDKTGVMAQFVYFQLFHNLCLSLLLQNVH